MKKEIIISGFGGQGYSLWVRFWLIQASWKIRKLVGCQLMALNSEVEQPMSLLL